MTTTQWIGVAILGLVFAFAAFAVRQGTKVKLDREGRDNWESSTWSGPSDGHGGSPGGHL